jgi:hypothetical protein
MRGQLDVIADSALTRPPHKHPSSFFNASPLTAFAYFHFRLFSAAPCVLRTLCVALLF